MRNKFEYEFVETQEGLRRYIQHCQERHIQQVAYSTFHDAITQVCFGCMKIRSNIQL